MPKLSVSELLESLRQEVANEQTTENRQKSDHGEWSEESDSWNMRELFFSRLTINNCKGFNPPSTFRESYPPPLKPGLVCSQYTAVSEHSCGQELGLHCHSRPGHACTPDPPASSLGFFIWSFDCWSSSCTFGEGFLTRGGFPDSAVKKNLPDNAGEERDTGSIPGLGRSPGDRNGYPLQYSCLEHSMDRGAWRATVHGVTKTWTQHDHARLKEEKREILRTLAHTFIQSTGAIPFAFFQTQGPQNHWSLLFRAPSIVRPPQFLHETMLICSEPADRPLGQSFREEI